MLCFLFLIDRGYGESDKPEGKEMYKMPLLVKDLKEIVSIAIRKFEALCLF